MRAHTIVALALAPALLACDSTNTGNRPVGGELISPTEVERFVRRAHLDLLGQAADNEFVAQARDEIVAAGNTATVRRTLVNSLLADPLWAPAFVEELEGRALAGDGYEFAYALLCQNFRQAPQCSSCQPSADLCSGCTCTEVTSLLEERTGLENAAVDLAAGSATGAIERRYAESQAFRFGQAIPTIAINLFEAFLGRTAEPDEIDNASALIVGFVAAPGNAAGLLFHRHGSNYADLVDIVFTSDVYRDAAVARVFDRYLGRLAKPDELSHFGTDLDPTAIDVRDILAAVISSREYFEQ